MPIIYVEGIKPPCKPYSAVPLVLLGEKEILRLTTPLLWLLPLNSQTFKFNFHLFKFSYLLEVIVIRRRKIAGTDPDNYIKSHLNYFDGTDRVVPEKGPCNLGVDETVPHDYSKDHLNYINGTGRGVPENGPGYLGVDETVSHNYSKRSP